MTEAIAQPREPERMARRTLVVAFTGLLDAESTARRRPLDHQCLRPTEAERSRGTF